MGETRTAPVELHDEDGFGVVMALRADGTTRGKARSFFASKHGTDFTEGRLTKTYYRFDADWEREQREDGIEEPYDGWPMWECRRDAEGAIAYWKYEVSA